jgi:ferric-dicitrate binding protein FerR (iron transport regulator)
VRLLYAMGMLWLTSCSADAPKAEAPTRVAPPRARAELPPARARFGALSGSVMVKRAAGNDWVAANNRTEVWENDKVRTAAGARATLRFVNGSEVSLGEDALVSIAENRPAPGAERTDLTILKGRIDAELSEPASQSLSVTTPGSTVRAGREIVFQ